MIEKEKQTMKKFFDCFITNIEIFDPLDRPIMNEDQEN